MQIQRVSALLLCVLLLFAALGCGGSPTEQAGGYQVTDAEGRVVMFEEKPVRVLNYALWLDDIVLGLVPPERLVGMDNLFNRRDYTNSGTYRVRVHS